MMKKMKQFKIQMIVYEVFNPSYAYMSQKWQAKINFDKLRKLQRLLNWDFVTFQVIYLAIIMPSLTAWKARIDGLAHITIV